jgi:dGTPase
VDVRVRTEEIEDSILAAWATRSAASRGRERPEPPDDLRTAFQRDRDRILHTKAFRRLKHKTQVFLAPEGDHYRTRLTHTLEVAQVGRTICRALRLNEDLVEAICLAHDVGHTPFGHVGEEALTKAMGQPFRHNEQSLRVVDHLEAAGNGLNLSWEVRDGILNHTWSMPAPSTPEAMAARWADRIAYINHDLDDALRAGVLTAEDVPADASSVLGASYSARVATMVRGVVAASQQANEVRMREDVAQAMARMRSFLFERVYLGQARTEAEKAGGVLQALYVHYLEHPAELPATPSGVPGSLDDLVADYVSGMTDRFAIMQFERLFIPSREPKSR